MLDYGSERRGGTEFPRRTAVGAVISETVGPSVGVACIRKETCQKASRASNPIATKKLS